jgi:hypothetical protein
MTNYDDPWAEPQVRRLDVFSGDNRGLSGE